MQAQVDNEFNNVRYDYLIRLTLAQKTVGNTSKLSSYGGEKKVTTTTIMRNLKENPIFLTEIKLF